MRAAYHLGSKFPGWVTIAKMRSTSNKTANIREIILTSEWGSDNNNSL